MSDEKKERENKAAVPKREKKLQGYRFLGGGFLPGVPARDLTLVEATEYGLNILDACPLYERVEDGE